MLHSRWRRATMAAVASLCASAAIVPAAIAAPGDLPDLVQSIPTAPAATPDADTGLVNWGGFFDDHSIGGDNHMGWSHSGSDPEALSVRFQSTLSNVGNGALELCGYPSSSAAWLRSLPDHAGRPRRLPRQRAAPPAPPAGSATRSPTTPPPVSSTAGTSWTSSASRSCPPARPRRQAPARSGTRRWGTCMNDNQFMDCEHDANANRLQRRHRAARRQGHGGGRARPDGRRVPQPRPERHVPARRDLEPLRGDPRGRHDLRQRLLRRACRSPATRASASGSVYGTGQPANCQLPTAIPGALTGPGGTDPFAGARPGCRVQPAPDDDRPLLGHDPGRRRTPARAHERARQLDGDRRRAPSPSTARWAPTAAAAAEPRRRWRRWHDHAAADVIDPPAIPPRTRA